MSDEASARGEQVLAAEVITTLCLATDLGMRLPSITFGRQIPQRMMERAEAAVEAADVGDRVHVGQGDILALDFPDDGFEFVQDEGFARSLSVMRRVMTRPAYVKKMTR